MPSCTWPITTWMSLQVQSSSMVQQFNPHTDEMNQENPKYNSVSLPNELNLDIITLNKELEEGSEFQEGGVRGWATVIGAILIQSCGYGYINAFGVFQDYYTRVYLTNESSSTIAWIGSINSFLIIGIGFYVGMLYDRGYFYHLLYGGSFLISFSLFMLSLIKPNHFYQNLLAQGVGFGLGCGLLYVPSIVVVSHYFKKRQTLAMTFVTAGAPLGSLIHPIMLNNLFSRVGYIKTTLFSAALITLMLVVACILMHPPLPTSTSNPPMIKSIRRFYKEWSFTMVSVGSFFVMAGFYYPFFFLQLDASKHGINETLTFYVLVIMNASNLVGRLSPGFFAHSLGVVQMIVASAICCSILIISMVAIGNVTSIVVIAVLYGYAAGMYIALGGPLIAFITSDITELGARLGVAYTTCGLGTLIGPPIQGALLSSDFVWWRPAIVSGIFTLIGASCFASLLFLVKKAQKSQAVV